eukprot:2487229-Rhodomonas_salina.10
MRAGPGALRGPRTAGSSGATPALAGPASTAMKRVSVRGATRCALTHTHTHIPTHTHRNTACCHAATQNVRESVHDAHTEDSRSAPQAVTP